MNAELLLTENLPAPRSLWRGNPGDCHVAMLEVFDEVLAELKAEGIEVDAADFLRRCNEAWTMVWSKYA